MSEEVRYVVLPKSFVDSINGFNVDTNRLFGFEIMYRSLDFEGLHSKYNVYSDDVLVEVLEPNRFDRFFKANRQMIRRYETMREQPSQSYYE